MQVLFCTLQEAVVVGEERVVRLLTLEDRVCLGDCVV